MRYKIFTLLLPFLFATAQELEVRLQTALDIKPLYLAQMATGPSDADWRYLDELRNVLTFDFNTSGFFSVLPIEHTCEQKIQWPDVKREFDTPFWKTKKIPFVLTIGVFQNVLTAVVFNTAQDTAKSYPTFPLTGHLETDRRELHKLADRIQKDLCGVEGIASLRLIYSQRTRDMGAWLSEIWISDSDGAGAAAATRGDHYCVTPSFYPHTAQQKDPPFVYVSYKTGQAKIYRSPADKPLIDLRGNQLLPSINAKGSQIAFVADAAGRPDLFVQSFDSLGKKLGKSRQLFSAPRATQASPTFSPDGQKIAFVSDKDGPPRIYVMALPSSKTTQRVQPHLLTKKNRENTSPAWSPDGKKIAYSANVEGTRQIWIYDLDAEEEVPLTTGIFNKENPAWAPDSLHLVYNTDYEDEGQLYLINLRQREPLQITTGAGQKRFASWETR